MRKDTGRPAVALWPSSLFQLQGKARVDWQELYSGLTHRKTGLFSGLFYYIFCRPLIDLQSVLKLQLNRNPKVENNTFTLPVVVPAVQF